MKNPIYQTFIEEVKEYLQDLDKKKLEQIILKLASQQGANQRNHFLYSIKNMEDFKNPKNRIKPVLSSEELFDRIKSFKEDLEDGIFYDEEKSNMAWDLEDRSLWRDYYEEDDYEIDYSSDECTTTIKELLNEVYTFYQNDDFKTALHAYVLLFDIFDQEDYFEDNQSLTYGYTFKEALGESFYNRHLALYIRCHYHQLKDSSSIQSIFDLLISNNLELSQLLDVDRKPLSDIDIFINKYIALLLKKTKYDHLLIDAVFIKGGMDKIKEYALKHGKKHPSLFLFFSEYLNDVKASPSDLIEWSLFGIKTIPEKFYVRSILAEKIISLSQDKKVLLEGHRASFYSNPVLFNLSQYLVFCNKHNFIKDLKHLESYLRNLNVKKSNPFHEVNFGNIYFRGTVEIHMNTAAIGKFLLCEIEPLLDLVSSKIILGFKVEKRYIPIIISLCLKTFVANEKSSVVDLLIEFYCFEELVSKSKKELMSLIINKTSKVKLEKNIISRKMKTFETVAVKRVRDILNGKKRGGYESACLLLTAIAEVKEILYGNGNELIAQINQEYKRFTAFRAYLKELTEKSKQINKVI